MTHSPKPQTSVKNNLGLSRLLWGLLVVYVGLLLLSPPNWLLPGEPIWAIRPETIQEILAESLNFFFVLPILSASWAGLQSSLWASGAHTALAPVVHPAAEAFFNLAEAWIFMFLPLLLLDKRGRSLPQLAIWGLAMFLTNVFLIPYMALRLSPPAPASATAEATEAGPDSEPFPMALLGSKARFVRAFGWVSLGVGTGAIAWFGWARPEFGGWAARIQYFLNKAASDRVTIAFCVDLLLFGIFQSWLMGAIIQTTAPIRKLRFLPFWGLAIWLITGAQGTGPGTEAGTEAGTETGTGPGTEPSEAT